MKHWIPLFVVLAVLPACTSARKLPEYSKPSALLQEEIDTLLRELPYRHGPELLATLNRLVYIGEPAIPSIVKSLKDDHPKARSNAAYVLGEIRDRRTIMPLREVLDDESQEVRYEAAASLLVMGDWHGIPVLIAALKDSDPYHRYKSIQILAKNTHQDLGYDYKGSEESRAAAVGRWENWYSGLRRTSMR